MAEEIRVSKIREALEKQWTHLTPDEQLKKIKDRRSKLWIEDEALRSMEEKYKYKSPKVGENNEKNKMSEV